MHKSLTSNFISVVKCAVFLCKILCGIRRNTLLKLVPFILGGRDNCRIALGCKGCSLFLTLLQI